MKVTQNRWVHCLLVLAVVIECCSALPRVKRQLQADDDANLTPNEISPSNPREKRKLDGFTQAKFGVKNAILGVVFGSTSTKNMAPRRCRRSLQKNIRATTVRPRPPTTTEDIPEIDRNRVSLDLPGAVFGPGVSLVLKSTSIIGEVVMNSALRTQTFLRLFRPLFKGQFEIKGLDPPTTTTEATTIATQSDDLGDESATPESDPDNTIKRSLLSNEIRLKRFIN